MGRAFFVSLLVAASFAFSSALFAAPESSSPNDDSVKRYGGQTVKRYDGQTIERYGGDSLGTNVPRGRVPGVPSSSGDPWHDTIRVANEKVDAFEKAVKTGDPKLMQKTALDLRSDPVAVHQLKSKVSPPTSFFDKVSRDVRKMLSLEPNDPANLLRKEHNKITSGIKDEMEKLAKDKIAKHFKVDPKDVEFEYFENPRAKGGPIKTPQDLDVTVRVKGVDVSADVAKPFINDAHFEAVHNRPPPSAKAADAFAKSQHIEVNDYIGAESYGGGQTEGTEFLEGPKDARLREPGQPGRTVQYKSDNPGREAAQLEEEAKALRAKGKIADAYKLEMQAQRDWFEQARQHVKQYDRQIESRLEALGGKVPRHIEIGVDVLRQVEQGTLTPNEARAVLGLMQESPETIISKSSNLLEGAHVLKDPRQLGPAPGDVFVENVLNRLKLKGIEVPPPDTGGLMNGLGNMGRNAKNGVKNAGVATLNLGLGVLLGWDVGWDVHDTVYHTGWALDADTDVEANEHFELAEEATEDLVTISCLTIAFEKFLQYFPSTAGPFTVAVLSAGEFKFVEWGTERAIDSTESGRAFNQWASDAIYDQIVQFEKIPAYEQLADRQRTLINALKEGKAQLIDDTKLSDVIFIMRQNPHNYKSIMSTMVRHPMFGNMPEESPRNRPGGAPARRGVVVDVGPDGITYRHESRGEITADDLPASMRSDPRKRKKDVAKRAEIERKIQEAYDRYYGSGYRRVGGDTSSDAADAVSAQGESMGRARSLERSESTDDSNSARDLVSTSDETDGAALSGREEPSEPTFDQTEESNADLARQSGRTGNRPQSGTTSGAIEERPTVGNRPMDLTAPTAASPATDDMAPEPDSPTDWEEPSDWTSPTWDTPSDAGDEAFEGPTFPELSDDSSEAATPWDEEPSDEPREDVDLTAPTASNVSLDDVPEGTVVTLEDADPSDFAESETDESEDIFADEDVDDGSIDDFAPVGRDVRGKGLADPDVRPAGVTELREFNPNEYVLDDFDPNEFRRGPIERTGRANLGKDAQIRAMAHQVDQNLTQREIARQQEIARQRQEIQRRQTLARQQEIQRQQIIARQQEINRRRQLAWQREIARRRAIAAHNARVQAAQQAQPQRANVQQRSSGHAKHGGQIPPQ